VVGGLSVLGAALYSIGIPKDSVIAYETALKNDSFLVLARGPTEEVARARAVLKSFDPSSLEVHEGAKTKEPAMFRFMLNALGFRHMPCGSD